MTLKVGDAAPDFTLPTDGGGQISLKSLRGKKVILYFYPKDDTSGCTKEACGFRDLLPDFSSADACVSRCAFSQLRENFMRPLRPTASARRARGSRNA